MERKNINNFNTLQLIKHGYSIEEIEIKIPNSKHEYNLIYISDLHIAEISQEVLTEHLGIVNNRIESFKTPAGLTAKECWEQLSLILDDCHADVILLGGDMVDFASKANLNTFVKGCSKIKTPLMFVGADHDFCPWWCMNISNDEICALYERIKGTNPIQFMEFEDFCIIGINNTTSQANSEIADSLEEMLKIQKPIILLQHVPLNSTIDDSLAEKSKSVWGGRVLAWGENCLYVPDENTQKVHDIIFRNQKLFKEVVSGHMHFTWDGCITQNIRQHVFKEAISGSIGVIKIKLQ